MDGVIAAVSLVKCNHVVVVVVLLSSILVFLVVRRLDDGDGDELRIKSSSSTSISKCVVDNVLVLIVFTISYKK